MERKFAFVADSAQESGGKVHALGIGIERIAPQQIPFTMPQLSVVLSLGYTVAEAGPRQITVRLLDADGRDVIERYPRVQVDLVPPQGGRRGTTNLIVNLVQTQFATAGDYAFHVTVDGTDIAELPLVVVPPAST